MTSDKIERLDDIVKKYKEGESVQNLAKNIDVSESYIRGFIYVLKK